jgi:Family of unknown function (DUF5995)
VAGSPIEPVIERMTRIASSLPEADGVARFNDLYLAVTLAVAAQATADGFEDPAFLSRLDVAFAHRYFAAVDAAGAGGPVPQAWAPLFDARGRRDVAPIRFALAGMNAHINFDLCLAVVDVCRELGIGPDTDSPQHRDYLRVNEILAGVQEDVKRRFETELLEVADYALGRVDDVIATWSVVRARDAAWTHAEVLWSLRPLPELSADYTLSIGRIVGLAGRGLLVPTL